jgi:hypothetical protein
MGAAGVVCVGGRRKLVFAMGAMGHLCHGKNLRWGLASVVGWRLQCQSTTITGSETTAIEAVPDKRGAVAIGPYATGKIGKLESYL